MILDDAEAWIECHPGDHWLFDKLLFSASMGYLCGPSGVPVPEPGWYVVRPVTNPSGMGVGARLVQLESGDLSTPAGYFWCEWLQGEHLSVDYHHGLATRGCRGLRDPGAPLWRWSEWQSITEFPPRPALLDRLAGDYEWVNVEFIGGRPIEVHLRANPDPRGERVRVHWADENVVLDAGTYISAYDDADGQLPVPRAGFYVGG